MHGSNTKTNYGWHACPERMIQLLAAANIYMHVY